MQSVSRFALLVCMSAFAALPAYAATRAVDKHETDTNIVESMKSGVAKPVSAWLVGPSQASAFDVKDHPDENGCLMVAEFDNGMIVGIHARAAGIVGMTVDTKQQSLTPGQPATLGLNLGGDSYVMNAVATDNSTLAVSLDEAGGGKSVVERLTGLGNFRLLIDQKPYYFATTGFTDGLARLQACMGATMAVPVPVTGPHDVTGKIHREESIETMRVETSGNQTPLALALPNLIPTGYRFVLDDVDPMTPISWQAGDDWVDVMRQALAPHGLKMSIRQSVIHITQRTGDNDPVVDDQQQTKDEPAADNSQVTAVSNGTWSANKGDNLASVLQAWGQMAGVNVKVDLMGDLNLPHDVKINGNFNDAVQQLLAQFSGSNKPVSVMEGQHTDAAPVTQHAVTSHVEAPKPVLSTSDWHPRSPKELKALEKQYMPAPATLPSTPTSDASSPMKQMDPIVDMSAKPKKPAVKVAAKKTAAAPAKKSGKPLVTTGTWQALQGTSLRDVLEHWGKNTGVRVMWMSDQNYPLPESFYQKGEFTDAVMNLLAQYKDEATHPEGQLNQDPDTGEKVLIIKSSGAQDVTAPNQ